MTFVPLNGAVGDTAGILQNRSQVAASAPRPHPFFTDVYTFDWRKLDFRVPLICSLSVAICVFLGLFADHPGAALIAGGGAATVGYGVKQRIADSRLSPMISATFAMFLSTMVGMLVGHRGLTLLLAVALWGFIYGVLTTRAPGIGWVGQQAAVTLIVTSAFPADFHHALERGLLMLVGGGMQVVVTTLFLRLWPELGNQLRLIGVARHWPLRHIPHTLPQLSHAVSLSYATRLALTVTLAAEVYRPAPASLLAHGFSLQFKPMCRMHQPVEDAVGRRWISDLRMPLGHRQLAGQQRGSG
jgi:uncharacterized membrane protein YjjB (DUF3815 family)